MNYVKYTFREVKHCMIHILQLFTFPSYVMIEPKKCLISYGYDYEIFPHN